MWAFAVVLYKVLDLAFDVVRRLFLFLHDPGLSFQTSRPSPPHPSRESSPVAEGRRDLNT